VSVVVPPVTTVEGEKLQEPPAGRPEHEKLTVLLNPFAGVIVTVVNAVCPFPREMVAGESDIEKSGGAGLIV
jgi:hypothetical protein